MEHLLHLVLKYGLLPVATLSFLTGTAFTGIGIYNQIVGNNTSGEFTYGIPLFVISIITLMILIPFGSSYFKESKADYIGDGLFWAII